MIQNIENPSIKTLKITLFFTLLISIFIALYTFLHHGIYIRNFTLIGTKIEGFYLRLNKKLILEIDALYFDSTRSNAINLKINEQTNIIKNAHFILQYFEKIHLKSIYFQDYRANLFYDGDNFMLNLPNIYAKLNLIKEDSKVLIYVQDFYFKPYGIYFQGNGTYNLRHQEIIMQGALDIIDTENYYSHLSLNLKAKSDLKTLHLQGSSKGFSDVQFLRELLPKIPNKLVEEWIFDNYSLESIRVESFSFAIPLKGNLMLQKALESLNVLATAHNVDVIFNPNLPPVHAQSVKITFANNTLTFSPQLPIYETHFANDSSVVLKDLISEHPSLELHLNTNAPLDSNITNLLKAYEIFLPISAPQANITTSLFLEVDLMTHAIQTKGLFKARNSEILLNAIPLQAEELYVQLDNHLIHVQSKNLTYSDMIQGDSAFIIDIAQKNISGDILVQSLQFGNPEILSITNHSLPFNINFKDSIVVDFPSLELSANLSDSYVFSLKNLQHIKPFSKILQTYKIQNGSMQLQTQDFTNFKGDFRIASSQNLLLNKLHLTPITSMDLFLHYTQKGFTLESKDSTFILEKTKDFQKLTLKGVALNLDAAQAIESENNTQPIIIEGTHTNLILKDSTLLSDSFNVSIYKNSIKGQFKYKNGVADFYKHGDFITLDAREFGDVFLNTLANKNIFTKGRFFVQANTNEKGVIIGKIQLLNTSINQLSTLQNLMAFIDTIPSLLSLKAPGFNQDGYFLKNGVIHFGLNQEFLAIDDLDFKGSSIDIKGAGIVQLESKRLDFNAKLITAKALSGIINKIPLVNYILLGKDGTISTNFKIDGTLENPQIHTQTTQEILTSPFNILKRVITSPFEVFN